MKFTSILCKLSTSIGVYRIRLARAPPRFKYSPPAGDVFAAKKPLAWWSKLRSTSSDFWFYHHSLWLVYITDVPGECTCIYIYIHAYRTCIHTYIHACIHPSNNPCIHTIKRTYLTLHYITLYDITWHYMTYIFAPNLRCLKDMTTSQPGL